LFEDSAVRKCILCHTALVGDAQSREHVIPASLGGRRSTTKALCRGCNSTTGHEWDAELEKQLLPASLMVFPHDHPRGRKWRRVADDQGNRLILKGGLRGGSENPQVHLVKMEDGRVDFHLSAPTKRRAVQEIQRLIKAGQLPADREEELIAGIEREETLTYVEFTEGGYVGGDVAWNSMLKSMVTAGTLAGLSWLDMLTAVQLLRGYGRVGPCLMFRDSPLRWLPDAMVPPWRHCVHVESDSETRLVWGYVEYFGTWCAIALLGKHYSGSSARWTYCLDPVSGDNLTDTVQVDLEPAKNLIDHMRVPGRAREIASEQIPDPQPLIKACLRAHGVDGKISIASTSYDKRCGGAEIKEVTWVESQLR